MSATARVHRAARFGFVAVVAIVVTAGCSKAKRIDRDVEGSASTERSSTPTASPTRGPDVNRFQLFEVDASIDLDPVAVDPLPEGLSLAWESVQGGTRQVRYATVTCAPAETDDACRTRLQRLASVFHPRLGAFLAVGLDEADGSRRARTWALRGDPILTGADIVDATAELQDDHPTVRVVLDRRAAARFGDYTTRHIRDRIAILTTGFVESAPVIQGRIDGEIRITMGDADVRVGRLAAERLASILRGD